MVLTFDNKSNNEDPFIKNFNILTELIPPRFLYRDSQLDQIHINLSPILKNQRAKNFFIYGIRGAGKTACVLFKVRELKTFCEQKNIKFNYSYINCGVAGLNNDINVLIKIVEEFVPSIKVPKTGISRNYIYDLFINSLIQGNFKNILIILDEVDSLLKGPSKDEFLFFLSRTKDDPALKNINISTIIISNNSIVKDALKQRTESSFGRDRIDFLSYNAKELLGILEDRAKQAFNKDVIEAGVLELITVKESTTRGDARRVLDLLEKCYRLALIQNKTKITPDLVEQAITQYDEDIYFNRIKSLTKHQQLLFISILAHDNLKTSFSENIYSTYVALCSKLNIAALDVRSIRNFIETFEEAGLVETEVYYEKKIGKKVKKINNLLKPETKSKCYEYLNHSVGNINLKSREQTTLEVLNGKK